MTKPAHIGARMGHLALKALPIVLVPAAFLASMPWLKTLPNSAADMASAAAAIFVMGYANYLAFRQNRGLDEVHRAGLGFAFQWGVMAGQTAFVLLLLLPPFKSFAVAVVTQFAGDPGMTVDRHVVVFAVTLGFVGVVLLQSVGTVVFNTAWWISRR